MDRIGNRDARRMGTNGNGGHGSTSEGQSVGQLFRQLSADSSYLIRQEIALAKTELEDTGKRLGQTAAKLGLAIGVAIPGMLALTAFLVIALGDLIDNYWAGALIVAVVLLGVAAVLAKRALSTIKGAGVPATAETLHDDARWVKQEVKAFKREFTA